MADFLVVVLFAMWNLTSNAAILVQPHCNNSLRIRISAPNTSVTPRLVGALSENCLGHNDSPTSSLHGTGTIQNGAVKAVIGGDGTLSISRVLAQANEDELLLTLSSAEFGTPACEAENGVTYFSTQTSWHGPNISSAWFGLGQLEAEQQSNCEDNENNELPCGSSLNRANASWDISSSKYHIGIPFLFNRRGGYGIFLNQPGDGQANLQPDKEGKIAFSFLCQRQIDIWITVAPFMANNRAASVYHRYAQATGLPSPLPSLAALYWQSRDRYPDQATVVQLAKNFSERNLSVGVIVIDLGLPDEPPYYRLVITHTHTYKCADLTYISKAHHLLLLGLSHTEPTYICIHVSHSGPQKVP